MDLITLTDQHGNKIGSAEKIAAHHNGGQLHLAFSIFIFNKKNELLLQKRAACKYHFANLWSNTCCGHPIPGEEIIAAAQRRLVEEFGFSTKLQQRFTLMYEAYDEKTELTEKEFLHILIGNSNKQPSPDPTEIGDWRLATLNNIKAELDTTPENYTPWFRLIIKRLLTSEQMA